MDRCKVYKDHLRLNCTDAEFIQQLKQDTLNEFTLFSNALNNDVINVNTNKKIKQYYNFKRSWIWVFGLYIYLFLNIADANEV